MGAVAIDGDLGRSPTDVTAREPRRCGAPTASSRRFTRRRSATARLGVIDFAIIDAAAHAWDLSDQRGSPVEFGPAVDPRARRGRGGDLHRRRPRARF